VAEKLDLPDRQVLEDQLRRLLDRARRRSGASVDEIVQILGDLQPLGARTRRSWYDWLEKPETVSALTALAALHLLGPAAAAEIIFGGADTSVSAVESAALEELRALLARVQDELSEQRRESKELRQRVHELDDRLRDRAVGATSYRPEPMQADELDRLINGLETQVLELGRKLDSPWAGSPAQVGGTSSESREHTPESMSRRISVLQGRMLEIRGMLGESGIDDTSPAEPPSAASETHRMAWVMDSVHTLLRQVAEASANPAVASITAEQRQRRARHQSG
jgi:hypothetical protein